MKTPKPPDVIWAWATKDNKSHDWVDFRQPPTGDELLPPTRYVRGLMHEEVLDHATRLDKWRVELYKRLDPDGTKKIDRHARAMQAILELQNERDGATVKAEHYQAKYKELAAIEDPEKTRWRKIQKTTPSGKTLFVCLACGRHSPIPDKDCREGVTIMSGGTTPPVWLDCETAYQRRQR